VGAACRADGEKVHARKGADTPAPCFARLRGVVNRRDVIRKHIALNKMWLAGRQLKWTRMLGEMIVIRCALERRWPREEWRPLRPPRVLVK